MLHEGANARMQEIVPETHAGLILNLRQRWPPILDPTPTMPAGAQIASTVAIIDRI